MVGFLNEFLVPVQGWGKVGFVVQYLSMWTALDPTLVYSTEGRGLEWHSGRIFTCQKVLDLIPPGHQVSRLDCVSKAFPVDTSTGKLRERDDTIHMLHC